MRKIKFPLIALTIIFSSQNIFAMSSPSKLNEDNTSASQSEVLDNSKDVENATLEVSELAKNYIKKYRKHFNKKNPELTNAQFHMIVKQGVADINVPATSRDWVDARTMAYTQAIAKARTNIISELYTNVETQTINEMMKTNKGPNFETEELEKLKESELDSYLDKLLMLANIKLDKELEEEGVDTEDFQKAPPEKRKLMMRKAITKKIKRTAFGKLSGSVLVKTFEVTDRNGLTSVAAVITTSAKKKKFIANLKASHGNIQPDPSKKGMDVDSFLEKHKANLMFEFGTKLVWDKAGYPVLLSFGQGGNDCDTLDMEECNENREFSFIDASNTAWGSLSELYNLRGKFESNSMKSSQRIRVDKVISTKEGINEIKGDTITKIIKEIDECSTFNSKVKGLVGVSQVLRWTERHPINNQEINGVVLMWHPLREQAISDFKKGVDPKNQKKSKKIKIGAGINKSLDELDQLDW